MPVTCVTPLSNCNCPIPISLHFHLYHSHPVLRLKPTSFSHPKLYVYSNNLSSLTYHPTNNCNHKEKELENHPQANSNTHRYSVPDHKLFDEFEYSIDANVSIDKNLGVRKQENQQEIEAEEETHFKKSRGFFTKMWWVDMKAALGQRVNIEGLVSSMGVFVKDQHLALPHVTVPDIRHIDWAELHRRGFKGVVFDKDNTITVPYSLTLWGPLKPSIEQCKAVFGNDIAVFSNSAGLYEYDHDDSKAKALERAIGIKVIRHRVKKPAGTAEEIEKHFGCKSAQLIMVGDRPFTDVVYGNRNGFLTILTEPLSLKEEPFIVRQVRKLEASFTSYWLRNRLKQISHSLLPDAAKCVKDV